MTFEDAIRKAIEGGYDVRWNPAFCCAERVDSKGNATLLKDAEVFFERVFWQSLGTAMGCPTKEEMAAYRPHRKGSHSDTWGCAGDDDDCWCDQKKDWQDHWHRFIDHLAEGKDAESFFESLT